MRSSSRRVAGEHNSIGPARFHDAAQALLLIVARRAHHDDQVEPAFREVCLQAGEEGDEERLAIVLVARMRMQHEGDRLSGAAAQVPARLVGCVVELAGSVEHALPRLGIDVGAAVEGARDRANRNVQMPRKVADAGRQEQSPQTSSKQSLTFEPRRSWTLSSGTPSVPIACRMPIDNLHHPVCYRKRLRKTFTETVNARPGGAGGRRIQDDESRPGRLRSHEQSLARCCQRSSRA